MEHLFETYLTQRKLSPNTIKSYNYSRELFFSLYPRLTQRNLEQYKLYLLETYRPQTVNLRIRGINCYLEFCGKDHWKLPFIKKQQKPFLENVISEADYLYLLNSLKRDGYLYWYFVVHFLASTGARIHEFVQFKVEHVRCGYIDIYSKGGKLRRIYIPKSLQQEALDWINTEQRTSGFLFTNRYGDRITCRGIASQLKKFALLYGIDPNIVYPHSFRHRFAKSFLERFNDIALLADLLGHENIETTRIYLRRSSRECIFRRICASVPKERSAIPL